MRKMRCFQFIFAFVVIWGIGLFLTLGTGEIEAGALDNVSGWAWSENIGWISFNCTDREAATGKTCLDVNDPVFDPALNLADYGVTINEDGKFSGHAWSEHIGWISFNESDTGEPPSNDPCSDDTCIARAIPPGWIGKSNVNIDGWARALTYDADWHGWLRFDHGQANEVYLGSDGDFYGWAWGSDVVGWVSFNCQDGGYNEETQEFYSVCATSDYKVTTSINLPPNPPSNLTETLNGCAWGTSPQAAPGLRVTLSWHYSDPDGDAQNAYEIWLDDSPVFPDPKFNHLVEPSYADSDSVVSYLLDPNQDDNKDWTADLNWSTTYYWGVKVKDEGSGQWSEFSAYSLFTTPAHAYPNPSFTPSPQSVSEEEVVEFVDDSQCYDALDNQYACKTGGSDIGYEWDFSYEPIDGFVVDPGYSGTYKGNATTTYSTRDSYEARLRISDNSLSPAGICTTVPGETVNVGWALPKWKEIEP